MFGSVALVAVFALVLVFSQSSATGLASFPGNQYFSNLKILPDPAYEGDNVVFVIDAPAWIYNTVFLWNQKNGLKMLPLLGSNAQGVWLWQQASGKFDYNSGFDLGTNYITFYACFRSASGWDCGWQPQPDPWFKFEIKKALPPTPSLPTLPLIQQCVDGDNTYAISQAGGATYNPPGQDRNIKSFVKYKNTVYEDYCISTHIGVGPGGYKNKRVSEGPFIIEQACIDGLTQYETTPFDCPYGCKDGACKSQQVTCPSGKFLLTAPDGSQGCCNQGEYLATAGACCPLGTIYDGKVCKTQPVYGKNVVKIETLTNNLTLNETIGSVRDTLNEFDLEVLKGGAVSTLSGVVEYNQYLKFPNFPGLITIFGKDQIGNVGHFLHVHSGELIFNWLLQFKTGLSSTLDSNNELVDLIGKRLHVLGNNFSVVRARFVPGTGETELILLGGPVLLTLGEGDKQTIQLGGKQHEVELLTVSNDTVILKVDGQTFPRMKVADLEPAPDGTLVGIESITPSTNSTTGAGVATVYLEARKLVFKDNNALDRDEYNGPDAVSVNNEFVDSASLAIDIDHLLGSNPITLRIKNIFYSLHADGLAGDIFIPPGHRLSEYLNKPEGMLTNKWDILFDGFNQGTGTATVSVIGN